jgi:DNA-binding CsgD family transcriptional regulator
MIHLILLAYALTVVMGTASAAYVLQARNSLKYDYLRPLYAYTVIFLVSVFGGQILEYVYLNILGGNFRDVPPGIVIAWTAFLAVVRTALLYTVGRAIYAMKGLRANGPFLFGFILIAALNLFPFAAFLLIRIFRPTLTLSPPPILGDIVGGIAELSAVGFLAWLWSVKTSRLGRRSFSVFGLSYFVWYAVQFVVQRSFNPSVAYYVNSVLLLPVSAIPFFWIKLCLLKEIGLSQLEEKANLADQLAKDHNISPREWEIINLLVRGKSNKEIEALLFISHSTVKNHIYNICQKMKVNSRLQLVSSIITRSSPPIAPPAHLM